MTARRCAARASSISSRDISSISRSIPALWRRSGMRSRRINRTDGESAVILARGGVIGLEHLPTALVAPSTEAAVTTSDARRVDRRERLATALRSNRGNVSAVARSLGKARSQVQRWIHDCGLDPAQYRDP